MSTGKTIKHLLGARNIKNIDIVRLGKSNDGGYVLANDFSNNDYLLSMGINDDVSIEKDLEFVLHGIDLYDHTINELPDSINNGRFFKEKVSNNISEILSRISSNFDIILKCDIEGSEWEMLETIKESEMLRFRQIALEIHWISDELYPGIGAPIHVLEKINKTHQLFSIHANNYGPVTEIDGVIVPNVLELSYARKSSYEFYDGQLNSAELHQKNNPDLPEITELLQN